MALLYRTIFSDTRPELLADVRELFTRWLRSKDIDLDLPTGGHVKDGGVELLVAEAVDGATSALRYTLHEEKGADRWSTTLTAFTSDDDSCVWVDLERVSEDPYLQPTFLAVPRLVATLLENGTAHVGPTPLSACPRVVDVTDVPGLVDELTDPDRVLPFLVVAHDRYADTAASVERAEVLLKQVAGVAVAVVLEEAATAALSRALGPELHVFGGAVRSYLPGLSLPDPLPKRHPFVAGTLFARQTAAAATRIQRSLAQHAVAQRPPEVYRERVAFLPGFPRHQGGSAEALFDDLLRIEQERDELASLVAELRDEVEFGVLQLDEAIKDHDTAQARVRFLELRLRFMGDAQAHAQTPPAAVPETVESCGEAVDLARQYLSRLEVGDTDAPASTLDTYVKSPTWARKAWRALRALDDYAERKAGGTFSGDFLAFCLEAPTGATTVPAGWVAMKESETTDNNPTFRAARTFPVPVEADESESVYMATHIKVEAGGRPAPRIHFHDATADTGLVYVGYFGPHLPNDRTN